MSDSMCYLLGEPPRTVATYRALALQTACHSVNSLDVEGARCSIRTSIQRVGAQIRASKQFIGSDLKLVVLPEYFATSYPLGETIPGWAEKAGFDTDGSEYDQLAAIAQEHQVYLASNAYERDKHFPGLYFQASVILSPSGEQVLRYRRLVSLFAPTPHDVWDAYLDHYGEDAVFPVAHTEIGNLACVASEEILYPEIPRALALRGAEVLLHSTSEVASPDLTPKDIAKRARAIESMGYVVSANTSELLGVDIPGASTSGMSKIIDDSGRVLASAGSGDSMAAYADIDLLGLRVRRRRPGMPNVLSRLPKAAISLGLSKAPLQPNGFMSGAKVRLPERREFAERQHEVIRALHGEVEGR